jgi:hypothetical protein
LSILIILGNFDKNLKESVGGGKKGEGENEQIKQIQYIQ